MTEALIEPPKSVGTWETYCKRNKTVEVFTVPYVGSEVRVFQQASLPGWIIEVDMLQCTHRITKEPIFISDLDRAKIKAIQIAGLWVQELALFFETVNDAPDRQEPEWEITGEDFYDLVPPIGRMLEIHPGKSSPWEATYCDTVFPLPTLDLATSKSAALKVAHNQCLKAIKFLQKTAFDLPHH